MNTETKPQTIEMTSTWVGVAHLIELGLINGDFEAQRPAREELQRMAQTADLAKALAARLEAAQAALDYVAEMDAADSDYVTREDMSEAIAETYQALRGAES